MRKMEVMMVVTSVRLVRNAHLAFTRSRASSRLLRRCLFRGEPPCPRGEAFPLY